jgi:predicted O-methyltransferase YrrM
MAHIHHNIIQFCASRLFWIERAKYFVSRIDHRPFDDLPLSGVGAEIGVWRGEHAARMLKRHPQISMLYCVDPYEDYDRTQADFLGEAFRAAGKRLSRFKGRHHFVACTSALLGKLELDFCYIDGNHKAPWPQQDIENVWPLIKSGGVMGGHDFHVHWPDVIQAVTEFAHKENLRLYVAGPDWWLFKP